MDSQTSSLSGVIGDLCRPFWDLLCVYIQSALITIPHRRILYPLDGVRTAGRPFKVTLHVTPHLLNFNLMIIFSSWERLRVTFAGWHFSRTHDLIYEFDFGRKVAYTCFCMPSLSSETVQTIFIPNCPLVARSGRQTAISRVNAHRSFQTSTSSHAPAADI